MLLLIIFLSVGICTKIGDHKAANEKAATLPAFAFLTIDGRPISSVELAKTNDKIIIVFFNPECEHCQYMAKSLANAADKLDGYLVVMTTIADSASVSGFRRDYGLDMASYVLFLRDSKFEFEKIFGTSVVPSFFVYKNRVLTKKIIGETKIENLLQ